MDKYIKSNFKGLLCLVLALCMLVGIWLPVSKVIVSAERSDAKMLYIKTSDINKRLYQRAAVEVGETYYFSFGLSTDITFIPICRSDGSRNGINANVEKISSEEKGSCTYYTYSFTIPAKDNSNNNMSDLVFFGIQISAACEGYFFSSSLYNSEDASKTELFTNPDFANGTLSEWAWDWDVWFRGGDLNKTEWSNNKTTLKVMNFDKSLIAEEEIGPKMLYIKTSETGKEIYQRATVTPGETYIFSFVLNEGVEFTPVCRTDSSRASANAEIVLLESKSKSGITKYIYSYKIPENDVNGNPMTSLVFFGFKLSNAYEGYLYSASVYNKNDVNKTELFENPDFSNGNLDRWAWGWDIWFAPSSTSSSNKNINEWSNDSGTSTLKIVDFDESILTQTVENMLYIKTDSTNKEFYQRAKVEVGKTYYFTFSLNSNIAFTPICRADNNRPGVNANITSVSESDKGAYKIYTYSYTIPEKDNNGNPVTESVFFGLRFNEAFEGFLFDAGVYEADDRYCFELLTNPDFADGSLNQWAWGWDKWFSVSDKEWSNENVLIKVTPYSETNIENGKLPDAPLVPDNNAKMLYIKTTAGKELIQRATVEVGKTYHFTFGITDSISNYELICLADGIRPKVEANIELVECKDNTGYKIYTYSYTIPEKDSAGNAMSEYVFFGIKLIGTNEGYFFNASLKEKDTDTELLLNPDFKVGLDEWAWGWDVWFRGSSIGLQKWNNEKTSIEILDYDESLFEEITPVVPTKKMLYVNTTYGKELYQRVAVEVGKTYYFTFSATDSFQGYIPVCNADSLRPSVEANIKLVESKDEYGYKTYTYSYDIPETDCNGDAMTSLVFIGIKFLGNNEGYIFDTSFKEKDTETELLLNPDFKVGLDEWAWGWDVWFRGSSIGLQKWNNEKTSIEILDYDESLFEEITPVIPKDKMLYIKTTAGKELIQRAAVEVGKTYHFTFGITDSISNYELICLADGIRPMVEANIELVECKDNTGYKIYTYSYTIPEKDSAGNAMSEYVFFGIKLIGTNEGYFFNASLKEKDTDTELLLNPDFKVGLDEWAWGWDVWFRGSSIGLQKWNNEKTSIEILDYDESLFEEITPVVPTKKMLYVNTTYGKELYQRVAVEVGKTYYFTFSATDSFQGYIPVCNADSLRPSVEANIKLVESKDEYGYKTYTYSYDIPETDCNGDAMTSLVFIGIKFLGNNEGYIFDTSFKEKDTETELLLNPDFKVGLDEWAWGWDIWFRGGNIGLQEWNNDKTTLKVVKYDAKLLKEIKPVIPTKKMLHIKTTAGKEIMQRAAVEVGKTYYFTFSISDSISVFEPICLADDKRPNVDANIELVECKDNTGYKIYTYSYTIPEKDSVGNAMTEYAFFGIKLTGASEGYIFDTSLKAKDSETELFLNPDFKVGLDEWAWGWDIWFRGGNIGLQEWNNDKTTLKLVKYDKTLLKEMKPVVLKEKMLFIKTNTGKELIQRATVEVGKTYYFTFSLTNSITYFNAICLADDKRPNVEANIKLINRVDKTGYKIYTYSYTIPSKDSAGNDMSANAFFGIKLSGSNEGYFFDASLKAKDSETELFLNPDFKVGLDEWAWGWDIWFRGDNSGLYEWSNDKTTLKLIDINKAIFKEENTNNKKMLYIKSSAPKELMQRVMVKPKETYYFTFSLTDTITSFKMLCRSDSQRNEINADIKLVKEVKKDGYTTYTYSYTLPETYINGENKEVPITSLVFFGFRISVSCEGYLFDTSVYKAGEKFKTELLENSDFTSGLDRWCWGWDVWFAHSEEGPAGLFTWKNDTTLLRVDDFDKELINKVNSNIPGKRMVYFVNGATSSHFAARVQLEPGGEYYMQFSTYSTAYMDMKVTKDGLREVMLDVEKELVSTEEYGNYTTYLYKFIMPQEMEENLVFVGPVVRYYSEGYIFDMQLYKADDTKQKNLWDNPNFSVGLDGWIWNWHAWFGGTTESGIVDWTNGANIVKVLDFDLNVIDAFIKELNVDDGVWWKPSDVEENVSLGTATLNGVLVDQNQKPIKDVEFVLESEEKSYKTVNDSEGKFQFKDFVEGFYELFLIDSDGNKKTTGFYTTFADGDVVTVNLVCDSSKEEVVAKGTIAGTVYTPELKTVSNLKIYIRDIGETVTDDNGSFEFVDVPVGEYDIYTILEDGTEHVFRTISVKENVKLDIKLKYDIQSDNDQDDGFNIIWIIIPTSVLVIALGTVIVIFFFKKRKLIK